MDKSNYLIREFREKIQKLNLSSQNLWKVYLYFPSEVLFLDIETEGLSKERNNITLIGIYKNSHYYHFIKYINLEKALEILTFTPIWISFGGENFDLPFIKKTFSFLETPLIHIDLFFLTQQLGIKGGLKKIEKVLGIYRKTEGLNGYDAVKLWKKWIEEEDKKSLEMLILYNKEDVINLKKIMDYVVFRLLEKEGKENEKAFNEFI